MEDSSGDRRSTSGARTIGARMGWGLPHSCGLLIFGSLLLSFLAQQQSTKSLAYRVALRDGVVNRKGVLKKEQRKEKDVAIVKKG